MFIEAVTLPPAVCEMRHDFNDPIVSPCRVIVDVNRGFSTVLFNVNGTIITITGDNMSGNRIDAAMVKAGDSDRVDASGECEISSRTMKVGCKFIVGGSQFHIEARF